MSRFLAPGCGAWGSGHGPGAAGEPSPAAELEPLTLGSASPWAAGWGPPALFQPPTGLSHVWESPPLSLWKQDLALLCLTAESWRPSRLAARLSVVSQHFQVGSTYACPLPYAVYFLELTFVTSHVALATEQLLCQRQPAS